MVEPFSEHQNACKITTIITILSDKSFIKKREGNLKKSNIIKKKIVKVFLDFTKGVPSSVTNVKERKGG